jgi:hypothetical protein
MLIQPSADRNSECLLFRRVVRVEVHILSFGEGVSRQPSAIGF